MSDRLWFYRVDIRLQIGHPVKSHGPASRNQQKEKRPHRTSSTHVTLPAKRRHFGIQHGESKGKREDVHRIKPLIDVINGRSASAVMYRGVRNSIQLRTALMIRHAWAEPAGHRWRRRRSLYMTRRLRTASLTQCQEVECRMRDALLAYTDA